MILSILDTRREEEFVGGHVEGAVNIPVEELAGRVHELPAGGVVRVMDREVERVEKAKAFLEGRGCRVEVVGFVEGRERGRSRGRLWEPSPFLVEAMGLIGKRGGRAIDVACGTGRDAAYMAMEGYAVTGVDWLGDALERARGLARGVGVEGEWVEFDLERDNLVPGGEYDLVVVMRYLHRPLWGAIRGAVKVGGYVVYETFHERNLETGGSPRKEKHLLKSGELEQAFAGFEILVSRDAVERGGRYFSQLIARKRD